MESRWTWRFLALPASPGSRSSFLSGSTRFSASPSGTRTPSTEPVRTGTPSTENVGTSPGPENIRKTARYLTVFLRTFGYVAIALAILVVIGYPVAYFARPHAGRWRGLPAAPADTAFWIQLPDEDAAWINLLSPTGWRPGSSTRFDRRAFIRSSSHQRGSGWLEGHPQRSCSPSLRLQHILILPLFAALDRIDQRQIEAERDSAPPLRRLQAGHPSRSRMPGSSPEPCDRPADVRRLLHERSHSRPRRGRA